MWSLSAYLLHQQPAGFTVLLVADACVEPVRAVLETERGAALGQRPETGCRARRLHGGEIHAAAGVMQEGDVWRELQSRLGTLQHNVTD
ncbi:MAG: hypothetical protein WKF61_12250 [Luteimonas sp.]